MGDLLRQGCQWLEQMRTQHCSSPVTYHRPPPEPPEVPPDAPPEEPPEVWQVQATFGRTSYEVADESGLTVGAHIWDFLILADALPGILPGVGDVIVANGRRYEVMPLGADFRGWRWSDPYRTTYRIHTKDIGSDT